MTVVLFLDVDGVLNSADSLMNLPDGRRRKFHGVWEVSPMLVERVLRVVERTGAKIVLSSGWRKFPQHLPVLTEAGLDIAYMTPFRPDLGGHERDRCDDIADWLADHPEVTRFAIVDDDEDAGSRHPDHFVRTDSYIGISGADERSLIGLLS